MKYAIFLTKQLNSCLLPDSQHSIITRTLSDAEPEFVREPLCHPTELQKPTKYRGKGGRVEMREEFITMDHFTLVPLLPEDSLLDMGRRRFFTSLCKCWLYQAECDSWKHVRMWCVCLSKYLLVCAWFFVSSGSGLGWVCSVHVKRGKRKRMCMAAVQVKFHCFAEEGATCYLLLPHSVCNTR